MRRALRLSPAAPLLAALLLTAVFVAACAGPRTTTAAATEADARRVVELLTGTFSSAAQARAAQAAAEDPSQAAYFDIRLVHVPIWTEREGAWLYVEQAVAARPDRPYRQRVYHVWPEADAVRSDVYFLPDDGVDFVNGWQDPACFDGLEPAALELRAGCTVYLRRAGERFVGATLDVACRSDFGGATHTTSAVEVGPARITSWDRGWNDAGDQVWGATDGPYEFDRIADGPPRP